MSEQTLVFYVKGSSKKPYRVAFWKEEGSRDIHSGCGCPAGRRMQYCKHRFQLIEGDLTNLDESTVNVNENLDILYEWLKDSDIGDFFVEFLMAKTGEKMYNLVKNTKFLYSDNIIHYKNSRTKEDFEFEYKELTVNEFKGYLKGNSIAIQDSERYNLFFPDTKEYLGSVEKKKLGDYKISKIGTGLYTSSSYLRSCYKLYISVDISEYNQKMKEIMR